MTPLLYTVLHMTLLTFAAIVIGGALRNREWTREGLQFGLSNRADQAEPTPLGGRGQRAASNSIEAMILFVPLALTAHVAGLGEEALLGAQVFFWARVAYLPVYWVGIPYLRSAIWIAGVAGLGMIVTTLIQ